MLSPTFAFRWATAQFLSYLYLFAYAFLRRMSFPRFIVCVEKSGKERLANFARFDVPFRRGAEMSFPISS